MSSSVTIRTRKFKVNRLLARRQMLVDVVHPSIGCPSKEKVSETLAKLYHKEAKNVFCYGFKTQFGGGKTTGFALIYDTVEDAKKFEPSCRLVRKGLLDVKKTKEEGRRSKKTKKTNARKGKKKPKKN